VGLKLPAPASAPYQQSGPVTINYVYDPLYRLTEANYSDGRSFGYQYDAVGNVLQYTQNLGGSTVTTTYNYNNANQLTTAQMDNSPIAWEYFYDPNGRLAEVLPDGIAANGAKRYTYNTAGYLIQTEAHEGSGYQLQAEMFYDGLGQRLSMTGYALGTSVTTNYVLDPMQYARPLTATSLGNTTLYLYGIDPIAEFTTEWAYSLPDGTNTPRQLTDELGAITLAGRYTPWGDSLDYTGVGNFTFGYFGGLMDSATGLLYVGNGQYYDPTTGRFLTRDVYPNSPNPYVPWGDPTGALFAPLALVGLIYGRKRKKSRFDYFVIVLFVAVGAGMGLSACGPTSPPPALPESPQPPIVPPAGSSAPNIPPPSQTPAPFVPVPVTPTAISILDQIFATPCPTPIWTLILTGTPTSSSIDEELMTRYQIYLVDGINGTWPDAYKAYILAAVKKVNEKLPFASVFGGFKFVWGCSNCLGFAITSSDKIEFRDFFSVPETNPKFIIHELGHAFDQKVCAIWNGRLCGDKINTLSPIRNRLKADVATMPFLNRFDYGSAEGVPPFSGFAGGENNWQFTLSSQTKFSDYPGEVWADMFLGWVYGNLATDRMNYMNSVMPEYLSLFR